MGQTKTKNYLRANIIALALISALSFGLVGTTYAYYSATQTAENMLITKGSEVYLAEMFSAEDKWLPGETKVKEVHFGNQYELDQVIRFKVTTQWYDKDANEWTYAGSYDPVTINWTDEITGASAAWVEIDGWYYYSQILAKQSAGVPTETPAVIESVTFSDAISNSGIPDDFSDKICRITIEMEALDVNVNVTSQAWGMSFTQDGTSLSWSLITP